MNWARGAILKGAQSSPIWKVIVGGSVHPGYNFGSIAQSRRRRKAALGWCDRVGGDCAVSPVCCGCDLISACYDCDNFACWVGCYFGVVGEGLDNVAVFEGFNNWAIWLGLGGEILGCLKEGFFGLFLRVVVLVFGGK